MLAAALSLGLHGRRQEQSPFRIACTLGRYCEVLQSVYCATPMSQEHVGRQCLTKEGFGLFEFAFVRWAAPRSSRALEMPQGFSKSLKTERAC